MEDTSVASSQSPPSEVMLHVDGESFGIYPFPLNIVEVDAENLTQLEAARQSWRGGTLTGVRCELEEHVRFFRTPIRTNPQVSEPVLSWGELPPSGAPIVLLRALPGFWLNRFRLSHSWQDLTQPGRRSVDLADLLAQRRMMREKLVWHAESLGTKFLSLRYHRSNFNEVLEAAKAADPNRKYANIRATAEFSAHDDRMYSILDELAAVHAVMEKIRTGKDVARKFHDLHQNRVRLPQPLSEILAKADWYEPFRLRRANATHAFGSLVNLKDDENDLFLYQHPDRLLRGSPADRKPPMGAATEIFAVQVKQFDQLVADLAIYLLSLFHPWDFVVVGHAPVESESLSARPVWVRNLRFLPQLEEPGTAWAVAGPNGAIAVRTDDRGGLKPK
jgi:hypothetical protein